MQCQPTYASAAGLPTLDEWRKLLDAKPEVKAVLPECAKNHANWFFSKKLELVVRMGLHVFVYVYVCVCVMCVCVYLTTWWFNIQTRTAKYTRLVRLVRLVRTVSVTRTMCTWK